MLLALHIASAVVGFGAVALAGFYASSARSPQRLHRGGALEETNRYFAVRGVAEWALLAVPVAGAGAVATDPGGGGLGQLWVVVALGLWVVAVGVLGLVARPARARLRSALAQVPVDVVLVSSAASTLTWAAALSDAVFVVALVDMVLQPV